jgi:circadian clock protein KaiC
LYVLKSRGMAHSNQIREFVITDRGLDLVPVYVGMDGNIFIGAARAAKASEEVVAARVAREAEERRREIREQRRKAFEAEQTALRARFEVQERQIETEELREERRERKAAREAETKHRAAVTFEPPRE